MPVAIARKAIEVLENLTRAFPKDTVSQLALVDIYSKVGRKADAERTLRQVLTVEPENAECDELPRIHARAARRQAR
jgi:predicted Zn-dependent protease